MNETRTTSILQRVPAILAVTASSYGLSLQAAGTRKRSGHGGRRRHGQAMTNDKSIAQR
jgi:hypothetical protein